MKRKSFLLLSLVLFGMSITACHGSKKPSGDDTPTTVAVESVEVSPKTLSLEVGSYQTLTATVLPSNATDKTVTWSSSAASIAKVENGKVTALAKGSADIIAKAGDKTDKCVVTVSEKAQAAELVSISAVSNKESYEVGDSLDLTVTATYSDGSSKAVTGYTVSGFDNQTPGKQTVTVTYQGKTATLEVTVNEPASQKVDIEFGEEYSWNPATSQSDIPGAVLTSPDTFYFWNDQNWCGSNVTMIDHYLENGKVVLSYTSTGTCDFGLQLFYQNTKTLEAGKQYKVSFKLTAENAGLIKVSAGGGNVLEQEVEAGKEVTLTSKVFTHSLEHVAFNLVVPVSETANANKFVISDLAWEEYVEPVATVDYYLVGGVTDWGKKDGYRLTVDADDANHYSVANITLPKDSEFKIVNVAANPWDWDGFGKTNAKSPADGIYTIHLYVQTSEAHPEHIAFEKTGDVVIEVTYHLAGDFNGWKAGDPNYLMTKDAENENIYTILVDLNKGNKVKVTDSVGKWYPDGTGNDYVVEETGKYLVTFNAETKEAATFELQKEPLTVKGVIAHYDGEIEVGSKIDPAKLVVKKVMSDDSEVALSAEELATIKIYLDEGKTQEIPDPMNFVFGEQQVGKMKVYLVFGESTTELELNIVAQKVYSGLINGVTAIAFVDASDEDKLGDTWIAQYKSVVTVVAGDVLTFKLDGEAIAPGAPGEANNASYNEGTITVRSDAVEAALYLKVYADGGYAIWLGGFTPAAPVVVRISASYSGGDITVGEKVDASKLVIKKIMSDESEVALSPEELATVEFYTDITKEYKIPDPLNYVFTEQEIGTQHVCLVFGDFETVLDLTIVAAPIPAEYYLCGTVNNWGKADGYQLTVDAEDANHYSVANVELPEKAEFKIVNTAADPWQWDNFGDNYKVNEGAVYTVHLYLQTSEAHPNHVELEKTGELTYVYYVAGSMNEWKVNEEYKLAKELGSENLYTISLTFAANDTFKIVDNYNHWFPEGMGNDYVINEAGEYVVTFNASTGEYSAQKAGGQAEQHLIPWHQDGTRIEGAGIWTWITYTELGYTWAEFSALKDSITVSYESEPSTTIRVETISDNMNDQYARVYLVLGAAYATGKLTMTLPAKDGTVYTGTISFVDGAATEFNVVEEPETLEIAVWGRYIDEEQMTTFFNGFKAYCATQGVDAENMHFTYFAGKVQGTDPYYQIADFTAAAKEIDPDVIFPAGKNMLTATSSAFKDAEGAVNTALEGATLNGDSARYVTRLNDEELTMLFFNYCLSEAGIDAINALNA